MGEAEQVQRLAADVKKEIDSLPDASEDRCIYRVPYHLRKVNEDAYRPWIVSVGPFYFQDEQLKVTNKLKMMHFKYFLQEQGGGMMLEECIKYVGENEENIRKHYADDLRWISSDKFITMILVDTIFVIQNITSNSIAHQNIELKTTVKRDLLLEENQLPFFILDGFYERAFSTTSSDSFREATLSYLEKNFPFSEELSKGAKENIEKAKKICHLVDLLRICVKPTIETNLMQSSKTIFPMSASEQIAAGVKFVPSKSKNLLDIRFFKGKGVMEIPPIMIHDSTESTFRSIVVLEQCHYYKCSYFIDYMFFLDNLINTAKDVEILVQSGIIHNWLGSNEEVVILFNIITSNVTLCSPKFVYADVSSELNKYARRRWNHWKAILNTKYFNHPWSIISVFYALLLLFLTIVQTIFTILQK